MSTLEPNFETRGELPDRDLQYIQENLTPSEKIRFLTSFPTRNDQIRNIVILTNERIILLKRGEIKLFGMREGFKGIPYEDISGVYVEKRKKYDLLVITLRKGPKEKFMIPNDSGAELTSKLRHFQTLKKRKEKRGETPLKKLEKLSDLRDKNIISEEKFEEKKKELLKDI